MKYSKLLIAAFAVITFAATANMANAQTASITASGTVLQPISVNGTADLDFGAEIFPGIAKTVELSAPEAAQFDITGQAEKEVNISFSALPEELSSENGTLPLDLTAGHNITDDASSATTFAPGEQLGTALNAEGGTLFIWLGGTVTPSTEQPAGDYSAEVTMDVSYSGN